jgi:hypothetical protein
MRLTPRTSAVARYRLPVSELERFVSHSRVTELGPWRAWCEAATISPEQVPAVVRGLVVHMDRAAGIADSRKQREARMIGVAEMLERINQLDPAPPRSARPVTERLVGHCRTTSVLACALYRELSVPARVRAGFAAYYADGREFNGDHWVVEVWDAALNRWRLVDPELDEATRAQHSIEFDPADVPRDQFILAGQAWLDCRSAAAGAAAYGPYPDATGWSALAAQLGRDAAALTGSEVGPFDDWLPPELSPEQAAVLDELAATTLEQPGVGDRVRELRRRHPWLVEPAQAGPGGR